MEPQQPNQPRPFQHPHLHNILPLHSSQIVQSPANSTPVSSPGLFSPTASRPNMPFPSHPVSEGATPGPGPNSPFLHPLQRRKVRETSIANVDRDFTTGRKHINQYEVVEEIGRGQHGKVKLARNLETGENVAIKIIPRYSKKRRLGKVTAEDPQRNTKREIAILKKIRHPNIVALLEVIDDPELKKIYMVLEHVELGEITWRKKGLPHICQLERRLVERGMRGEPLSQEEEDYRLHLERKHHIKEVKRARAQQLTRSGDYWSLEHGLFEDGDFDALSRYSETVSNPSLPGSRVPSQTPSRTQSARSLSKLRTTTHATEPDLISLPGDSEPETPAPLRANLPSASALDGTMYGPYAEDPSVASAAAAAALRARSPSMADSIISHMSSVDFSAQPQDPFADDFSYVPCFTMESARSAFRDTVLGLEFLHYNGVVHRDIKPANLLWTKDFRVKISDFGVSYFGRPIRDGELDDLVSESEALDFDDDRELSKTVGTPAFFAPELCHTDTDKEPPRVSEQIDVWSLGVTLYCIIFARIPFLAEDEFSMFKKIAIEEVYIPRRRLRPVFPFTDPTNSSLYRRVNSGPYRDDEDASYEEIDDDLYDLLRRMLLKNPDHRIRLREVKRHPWLVRGIPNINGWVDETDPNRTMSGRPIEVDEREIGRAVVPLTFLERAKSTIKKTIGKVMHPRGDRERERERERERGESFSRRRAASSVASSTGDSSSNPSSAYPLSGYRDLRRKSIRGDDFLATVTQMPSENLISRSVTASPRESPHSSSPVPSMLSGRQATKQSSDLCSDVLEPPTDRQTPTAPQRPFPRHVHARSFGNSFLSLTPNLHESRTVPASPCIDSSVQIPMPLDSFARTISRSGRVSNTSADSPSRARSMDRAGLVFPSSDKHAEPKVGLSPAVAPGSLQHPRLPRQMRSVDLSGASGIDRSYHLPPGVLPLRLATSFSDGRHPKSESNIREKRRSMLELEDRPSTSHRIGGGHASPASPVVNRTRGHSVAGAPPPQPPATSMFAGPMANVSLEKVTRHASFRQRREEAGSRHQREEQQPNQERQHPHGVQQHLVIRTAGFTDPAVIPCPPSPDYEPAQFTETAPESLSRAETIPMAVSSSSTSLGALAGTPMTSPVCPTTTTSTLAVSTSRDTTDAMLTFQSDPSLPALLSGASSVSADMEGDFLGNPGVVDRSSLITTTDSLTPPAPAKESLAEFPLDQQDLESLDAIAVHLDSSTVAERVASPPPLPPPPPAHVTFSRHTAHADDDNDSDSDEGLMIKPKKKPVPRTSHHHFHTGSLAIAARRRDTNTSIGSTETAKKVDIHSAHTPL